MKDILLNEDSSMPGATESLVLDLQRKEQFDVFCEKLGGVDELKRYPMLWENIQKVNKNGLSETVTTILEVNNHKGQGVQNTVFTFVRESGSSLVYSSQINMKNVAASIMAQIEIINKATGRQVGLNIETVEMKAGMTIETEIPKAFAPETVDIITTVVRVDGTAKNTAGIQAAIVKKTVNTGSSLIKSYKIEMPVRKEQTSAHTYINVSIENYSSCSSLGRSDYTYNIKQHVYSDSINFVPFFLPFKGFIEFDSKIKLLPKEPKVEVAVSSLPSESLIQGSLFYNMANRNKIEWKFEGNRLSWTFLEDWDNILERKNIHCSNKLAFYACFELYYAIGNNPSRYTVYFASMENPVQSGSYIPLDYINLSWGCLEQGTKVLMADGSEKRIDQVCIGDRLSGMHGVCEVCDVITGHEDSLVTLKTVGGKELSLTHDHPVLTERGTCPTREINASDRVCVNGGEYESLEWLYEVNKDAVVYNLRIEPSDLIFANGIAVGDFDCQPKPSPSTPLYDNNIRDIIEEMKKLRESLMRNYKR